jgi:prepilin-type N-terminal cleavage/methylation domain-containing protein/prepilin-type processing-associated H-X9-DG protein
MLLQERPYATELQSRVRSRGFTLVELLVVIGIVSLLIGILLPALSRAQDQANTVQCLSNLRQIGAAIANYAADNQGYLVPGRYDASTYPANTAVAELENWATILVNSGYLPTPPQAPSLNTMWDTSYGTSVFRCPAGLNNRNDINGTPAPTTPIDAHGAFFTRLQSASTQVRVDTWYGINGWTTTPTSNEVNAFGRWPFTDLPYPNTGLSQKLHKLTDFQNSAELVLVFDGFYWAQQEAQNVNCRHKQWSQTNLLMADGHAQTINLSDLTGFPNNQVNASDYSTTGAIIYTTGVGNNLKTYQNGFRFILTNNITLNGL